MLRWLERYFVFTVWERRAVVAMLLIAVAANILLFTHRYIFPPEPIQNDTAAYRRVQRIIYAWQEELRRDTTISEEETAPYIVNPYEPVANVSRLKEKETLPPCFPFDPNTATDAEWQKLGFSTAQSAAIQKFISRGGRFTKPEDLRKLYVISDEMYQHILPCVQIPEQVTVVKENLPLPRRQNINAAIDVNAADSAAWESLPGIGPVLATRIVRYREALGGFVQIEQLREVWGMPDSTYQKIRNRLSIADVTPRKIPINTADEETLRNHPYIRHRLARLIVQYRQQHRRIQSSDELMKIPLVNDSMMRKLQPYIAW
ncbi:MAG: helix-hairpin-helix domain-containing protein [Chitinophagales bacterium]|nr:helix-hairpin-helix domain-containing protein [Chitinophagales bacterium]MDW8417827.1 helix-hairpin-helix domain-containing protein [Chitinophagales bacterium]